MDANEPSGSSRQGGGSIQPTDFSPANASLPNRPKLPEAPGTRYELRDPREELTYRFDRLEQTIAKAEQLGANRFYAVEPDGARTPFLKLSGQWAPSSTHPARPQATPLTQVRHISEVLPQLGRQPEEQANTARTEPNAEREARVARIEAALNERYIIKRAPIRIGDVTIGHTEYRHRGDTTRIAFTESALRLTTDTNSPSVARSMVDVAEARGWRSLRVSGHEDFKRLVWIEASIRNLKTVGYEPVPGDQELLRKEITARAPASRETQPTEGTTTAQKASGRGSGGRKTVLVALEAVLIAQRVPARLREAVMAAAEENLALRLSRGEVHRVKVYDRSAPAERPAPAQTRTPSRDRDRPSPTR